MTNPSQSGSQANNPLPQTEAEAEICFATYRSLDPYPDIDPALLNSADIYDYVAATGMIWPFDPEKLKSASYEVKLLGKCVYCDGEGEYVRDIQNNQPFILKANSIAFVTLEPTFRLPDYIALRFNLKITNVYRGLLLGTGPLVDPGFVGKLSLPLHNLTSNDYKFMGGEPLIWMEFTKLSSHSQWNPSSGQASSIFSKAKYKEFRNQPCDVEGYLRKADSQRKIRSSIPNVIQDAQNSAKKSAISAEEAAEKAKSIEFRVTWGSLIAIVVSIIAVLAANWSIGKLFLDTYDYVSKARTEYDDKTKRIESLEKDVQALNKKIKDLENSAKGAAKKPAIPQVSPTPKP
jgi:deoxycytidine triphosphate deaminase